MFNGNPARSVGRARYKLQLDQEWNAGHSYEVDRLDRAEVTRVTNG